MNEANAVFIILISTGCVSFLVGIITLIKPPKKINRMYGYRTKRSMQSQKHWQVAQPLSAKYTMALGILFIILAYLIKPIRIEPIVATAISLAIIVMGLLLMVTLVEIKLIGIKE